MGLSKSICKLTNDVARLATKKSPEILAGAGIACFIFGTVSAIKSTPKAVKDLEEKKEELQVEELPIKETAKIVAVDYWPTLTSTASGIIFVAASVHTSNKRYLSLGASYEMVKDLAYTYREKVIETIGEKKEQKIRDEIAQDKLDKDIIPQQVVISNEKSLFKDGLTGQFFREDVNKVKNVFIEMANRELANNYISEEEVLYALGLNVPESAKGKGWSLVDQGKALTMSLSSCVAHQYGDQPCLVINYDLLPMDDYDVYYK